MSQRSLPHINIAGIGDVIVVTGAMGPGVSNPDFVAAAINEGLTGTLSGIALDRIMQSRMGGRKPNFREAARLAIEEVKSLSSGPGCDAINCMHLMDSYADTVRGAIDAKIRWAFVGAGLATDLAEIAGNADVGLSPIVSSVRALKIICERWKKCNRGPDAVVVEGPLAGGHLGFKIEDIRKPEFQLEAILPPIVEYAEKNGGFPVIAAGGIRNPADISRVLNLGASGVQMATYFLATEESGATAEFKQTVINSTADDIIVVGVPGSPSRLPFRILKNSPGYIRALERLEQNRPQDKCKFCYMKHNGVCLAEQSAEYFCICSLLLGAIGMNPDPNEPSIFTVGAYAFEETTIEPVKVRVNRLRGIAT